MRLLNSNIVNFGYPIYNTSTGYADATVLFFEAKPDLTQTVYELVQASVATTSIRLQAVAQGYKYLAESSVGIKAIEGSEYWPEYGITIHHPKVMFIKGEDLQAIPSLPLKQAAGATLSHPIPENVSAVAHVGRAFYEEPTTFNCLFRIQRDAARELKVTRPQFGNDPAVNYVLPAGQMTEAIDEFTMQHVEYTVPTTNQNGRLIYAQVGDHTTTPIKKTLAYAVIVFTRYGAGNTPTDNVVFGTEVGATGSGAFLELFKTELSTGQYPIITNLRTGIL